MQRTSHRTTFNHVPFPFHNVTFSLNQVAVPFDVIFVSLYIVDVSLDLVVKSIKYIVPSINIVSFPPDDDVTGSIEVVFGVSLGWKNEEEG